MWPDRWAPIHTNRLRFRRLYNRRRNRVAWQHYAVFALPCWSCSSLRSTFLSVLRCICWLLGCTSRCFTGGTKWNVLRQDKWPHSKSVPYWPTMLSWGVRFANTMFAAYRHANSIRFPSERVRTAGANWNESRASVVPVSVRSSKQSSPRQPKVRPEPGEPQLRPLLKCLTKKLPYDKILSSTPPQRSQFKLLRAAVQLCKHGLTPSEAATEFFRLGVEIGMEIHAARTLRDATCSTR